ncbi:MAG: hypothetical protein PHP44_12065 [Kiritimatiellae bacterium]|nr:hypothetical protein [Kiritimatiellia bacterium]
MIMLKRLHVILFYLFLLVSTATSDQYMISSNILHPSATSWFDTGAGQSFDGVLYDNKLAQTFVPLQAGFIESISIAVDRMDDTTAPLRVRLTDTIAGIPNSILSEKYVDSSNVPTSLLGRPHCNMTLYYNSSPLFLNAGQRYALVFDSVTPEANYRIHGSYEYSYTNGNRLESQNTNLWTIKSSGDLFFEIYARSRSEIQTLTFSENNIIKLEWTNSVGQIWIDQSSDLVYWQSICGPITGTNSWAGEINSGNKGYIRIRQTSL